MYSCNICHAEVAVDHINPPKFNCACEGAKVVTSMEGWAFGRSQFGESQTNNNLSEASAIILRNTLFAIAANEFMHNKKHEVFAEDVRIKDSVSGKEFSFNLKGKSL